MCGLTSPSTHCLVEEPSLGVIIPYSIMAAGAAGVFASLSVDLLQSQLLIGGNKLEDIPAFRTLLARVSHLPDVGAQAQCL